MTRARAFISHFASKFFHDALPVALAGVVATLALGQFTQKSEKPEAPAAAAARSGEDNARRVRDEHSALNDALKRDADAKRAADAEQARAHKAEQLKAEQLKAEQIAAEKRAAKARELVREESARKEAAKEKEKEALAARENTAPAQPKPVVARKTPAEAPALDLGRVANAIASQPAPPQPQAPAQVPAPVPAPAAAAAPQIAPHVEPQVTQQAVPQLPPPVTIATRQAAPQPLAAQPALQPPQSLAAHPARTETAIGEEPAGVTGKLRNLATGAGKLTARAWNDVFDISTPPIPPAPIPSGRFDAGS